MKTSFIPTLLALAAFFSCERSHEPVMPASITVDTDCISLSKAEIDRFSFTVTPSDADFDYNVGNAGCQIQISIIEPSDAEGRGRQDKEFRINESCFMAHNSGRYRILSERR